MTSRRQRILSQRNQSLSRSGHIVEDNLNRKSQLVEQYQTDIQNLIERMDSKTPAGKNTLIQPSERRSLQRSKVSSRKSTIPYDGSPSTGNQKDYQKLIVGLQYALQGERNKREMLQSKNYSLETEISNLRNILVGPNEGKHYEKTVFKEFQEKISILEQKIIDQKKNYQYIIDSKNQGLASLEFQLRTLEKKVGENDKDNSTSRKLLQMMAEIEQLRASITKKNIVIEKLRFHKQQVGDIQSDDDEAIKRKSKAQKLNFYAEQLQISNSLILRKNIEILNLNKKTLKFEEVMDVIQQYLDKKEVKNVDLNILEHACVNKLRLLLREKAVFQRQLLNQLNEHNKKITQFQTEILERDSTNGSKLIEVINDNKRLTALVNTLQNNIKNLEKSLEQQRRQSQMLRHQIEINKKQFIQDVKKLKDQLNAISSVTKNQFDRMKIQNLKLSEQNKSLLFLVGEKQKQIHKKGESIKTFQDYKEKINNLNVSGPEIRKIQSVAEDNPQIGTKLILMNTFSQWIMEWNKIKNWNNKKVLLNIILDKEEIRTDSLNSMSYLISVLHQALLNSKNIEIQERAIILFSHYVKHGILKNVNLFVDKIAPIIVRGFRPIIEGEEIQKNRLLNEASLRIVSAMQRNGLKWSPEMTNQMLSINGLKYLFTLISTSQVDELVQQAYNCLILIAKQNEMISFMNSFNITTILLNNAKSQYSFIIYLLHLLKALLKSRDYIKSQKSLLDFRKIYNIIRDDEDEETVDLTLDCALILMQNSLFVKSLNKIQILSILAQALKNLSEYNILKKIGQVYTIILPQLQTQFIPKIIREADKLIDILNAKKFNENRFNRAIRLVLKIAEIIVDNPELDQKIVSGVSFLYGHYDSIEAKTRVKLNSIINTIYQRNKEVINKVSNENWIVSLVEAYKLQSSNQQLIFLLKILQFQHEQKKTTEILRSGRQTLINKLINDSLILDYNVAHFALKNLLSISKQKYAQKFVNKALFTKIINKVLSSRNQQEFIGIVISILYFFCKNQEVSGTIIELGLVQKVFHIITQRHDKQNLVYKCFTLLQLCHTTNYKRKILNYLLSNDSNLQILKTINFILKKAKNKQEMGTRVVFLYDFLNGKTAVQSMGLLTEQNLWMVQDLIQVRNQYVGKVDSLVYKIQLLLHNMSTVNAKVRKIYEKFKIQGQYESEDDR